MPSINPTVEQVLDAVKAQMDTLPSIGSVRTSDTTLEDDVDFLEGLGLLDAATMDLWIVELAGISEQEGDAAGEVYDVLSIRIKYWSLRTGATDWSKQARQKAEQVRDFLAGNTSVFRIGGQVQLFTPETVQIDSHGPLQIKATEGGQMVYQVLLSLMVETRRWS